MQTNIPPLFHQQLTNSIKINQNQMKSVTPQPTSISSLNSHLDSTAISQSNDHSNENAKIKSPMCLINELARSCKVEHKYILEDEKGPAHKKIFTIRLKLGEEEYVGEDTSIKKAQHAAAQVALKSTSYNSHPRKNKINSKPANKCITPTVELNGLVMKKGQPVTYFIIEKPRQVFYPMQESNFPKHFRQVGHGKQLFTVRLNVGSRHYIGQGSTVKAARNHAAELALQEFAKIPQNHHLTVNDDKSKDDANKSVMMLVHEIIHKRKMNIKFEMVRETGPSHLRIYVMQCSSGDMKAEGEGRSKKAAKNEAAKNLLPQLLKLPPLENNGKDERPKRPLKLRKRKNINKTSSLDPDYGSNINPSSRLLQIQQAKKEPLPIFKFIETTPPTDPTNKIAVFTVEVEVGGKSCVGVGQSKKAAKRVAAEEMLKLLGYYPTSMVPSKPAIKNSENQAVKINESKVSFSTDEKKKLAFDPVTADGGRPSTDKKSLSRLPPVQPKNIQKQEMVGDSAMSYKNTLLSVCSKLDIQSQFNEMPKRADANYLTLLSLATDPQLHSHGEGATRAESYEAACCMALQSLKEHGIDIDSLV